VDPDHLAAIDGMVRLRRGRWNGVWFAVGHSFVVTLLAVGIGHLDLGPLDRLGPYLLVAIGVANLVRLLRSGPARVGPPPRLLASSPLILGILFAAGFETASQISALVLADKTNAWLLGLAFGSGMVIVDGIDGYNASGVQFSATSQNLRGRQASRILNILVVVTSFGLAAAAFANCRLDAIALPLGAALFVCVFLLRVWGRQGKLQNSE
jgi:high-affinity nickel-transport protein